MPEEAKKYLSLLPQWCYAPLCPPYIYTYPREHPETAPWIRRTPGNGMKISAIPTSTRMNLYKRRNAVGLFGEI